MSGFLTRLIHGTKGLYGFHTIVPISSSYNNNNLFRIPTSPKRFSVGSCRNYVQYNAIQYNTMRYNTIQYNAIRYAIRYDTISFFQCSFLQLVFLESSQCPNLSNEIGNIPDRAIILEGCGRSYGSICTLKYFAILTIMQVRRNIFHAEIKLFLYDVSKEETVFNDYNTHRAT